MAVEVKGKRSTKRVVGVCIKTLLLLIVAEMLAIRYLKNDGLLFQILMIFVLICAVVFTVFAQGIWKNLK